MKFKPLIVLVVLAVLGFGYYLFFAKQKVANMPVTLPSGTPTPVAQGIISPTPYPDTQHAIAAFLANKYQKPISEVKVTVVKEIPGFASGSVLFGQGGPGEGGMWLAILGNGWEVVWDGNGNVDCTKIRQQYGFPDTILKPNFCD
ncbi:MAG TPA: hypothetical protein VI819_03340 [Patescibacteria group bacterium]|nr:hypothetical protein [Patescibacteria group bacterium]